MHKKLLTTIAFIVLNLALVFTSCSPKVQPNGPIKIVLDAWPGYAYAYLAQKKGFFKKNNVEVELVIRNSSAEALKLFIDSDIEGCFATLADTVLINNAGCHAKIVSIVDYSEDGDVIVGRPEINSLSGLKGKRISFEGVNSFSHIFVLTVLMKVGLKEYDVKFENIEIPNVLMALEEKRIDAGHVWGPVKSQALKKGYRILSKAGDLPGIITDVLIFKTNVLNEKSVEIFAIVKSLFEALDYLLSHKAESIKIMAESMGMSLQEMEEGLAGIHQLDIKENVSACIPDSPITSLSLNSLINSIMDFYLKQGQLFVILITDDIVDLQFLKALNQK